MLTISTENYLGRSVRFNQLPTFIATSEVGHFRMNWMSSAKNLSPTESYAILTAKTRTTASSRRSSITVDTFSAQERQQPDLHSTRQLLDNVDAAWLNSANVTDRN